MSFNITPVASGYREIHPYSAMNIDSVKINTSLIMMKECPVQLCVLGQNNCPGQFLRCFIVSGRWATWQPSVALLHFLSRSPPSTNANTNINIFLNIFQLFKSFVIMCDLLKYSSILCLAEVLWNLVGNFVWNIAAAHKTALIYSEIRSYIRILHLGYHWEPHFFWVNSWTMLNSELSLLWKVIKKPESTFSH